LRLVSRQIRYWRPRAAVKPLAAIRPRAAPRHPSSLPFVGNTGIAPSSAAGAISQSNQTAFVPTTFAGSAAAPAGGSAGGTTTLATARTVGAPDASTLAGPAASVNLALVPANAVSSVAGLLTGVIGIFISNGTEEHPNAGLLIGNGWDARNGQNGGNGGLLLGSGGGASGPTWRGGPGGDGGGDGTSKAGTGLGGNGGDGGHGGLGAPGGTGGKGGTGTGTTKASGDGAGGDNGAHG
jgi:hypothetical protein